MKKLMKRSLAVVLALIMCVSMLNLTAFAATNGYYEGQKITGHDGKTYTLHKTECGGWYYTYNDATTGYKDWKYVVQSGEDGKHKDTNSHDHQCDYCNVWMWLDEFVDQGHKDPTCTEDGYDYLQCSQPGCSVIVKTWNTIPKLDHKQNGVDQWHVIEQAVPATCTTAGKTAVEECSICHARRGGEVMPVLGHHLVDDNAVAATCLHTGLTAGKHCDRKGCTHVEIAQTATPALIPNYSNWTADNASTHSHYCTNANCDNPAHYATGAGNTEPHVWGTAGENGDGWIYTQWVDVVENGVTTGQRRTATRTCATCGYQLHADYQNPQGADVVREQGKVAVNYRYVEAGTNTELASGTVGQYLPGETYTHTIDLAGYARTGYSVTVDNATQGGTATKADVDRQQAIELVFTLTYTANNYPLSITYVGAGDATPAAVSREVAYDSAYEVVTPDVEGYTPDIVRVEGTMDNVAGKSYTVTYTANPHTLTVVYTGLPANLAIADNVSTVRYGANVAVDIPAVAGYTGAIRGTVPATMPNEDLTVYVDYTANAPDTFSLYVRYVYEDGTTAATSYYNLMSEGDAYNVASPAIEGYTPDQAAVSGTMGTGNVSYTVTYTADEVEIEEPDTPQGNLPEEPEQPEVPEEPEQPEEPIEVEEPETPLGPLPELPEEVEIEDPDVPLANVPQTGDNTALWVSAAAASGIGLIWLAVDSKKRREDAE